MKEGIHSEYHEKVQVTCSCGNSFQVGSSVRELEVEVCSACHPFYTGKQKLVDVAGRIDRFKKRLKSASRAESSQVEKTKPRKANKRVSKTVKLGD